MMSARSYMRKPMFCSRNLYSLATMAWKKATIITASSIEVIMSHTRNSKVLKNGCGRRSHQIFLPLSMQLVFIKVSTNPSKSAHELNVEGMPVRGNCCHTIVLYDFNPVTRPCQKGELADSASRWGRK